MSLNNYVLSTLNILTDLKRQKENIICTMEDVLEDLIGPPHGTTPAAVKSTYKLYLCTRMNSPFKASRLIAPPVGKINYVKREHILLSFKQTLTAAQTQINCWENKLCKKRTYSS